MKDLCHGHITKYVVVGYISIRSYKSKMQTQYTGGKNKDEKKNNDAQTATQKILVILYIMNRHFVIFNKELTKSGELLIYVYDILK